MSELHILAAQARVMRSACRAYESSMRQHLESVEPARLTIFEPMLRFLTQEITVILSGPGERWGVATWDEQVREGARCFVQKCFQYGKDTLFGWQNLPGFLRTYWSLSRDLRARLGPLPGHGKGDDALDDLADTLPLAGSWAYIHLLNRPEQESYALLVRRVRQNVTPEMADLVLDGECYVQQAVRAAFLAKFAAWSERGAETVCDPLATLVGEVEVLAQRLLEIEQQAAARPLDGEVLVEVTRVLHEAEALWKALKDVPENPARTLAQERLKESVQRTKKAIIQTSFF